MARLSFEGAVKYALARIVAATANIPAAIHGRRARQPDRFVSSTAALAAVFMPLPDELAGADNASNAKPKSCAEWKRRSGFFSRQRRTILSSDGLTFGFDSLNSSGSSLRMAVIFAAIVSPPNPPPPVVTPF